MVGCGGCVVCVVGLVKCDVENGEHDVASVEMAPPQGHFAYDSHKGGGVTMSHIRFGPSPHMPEYEIQQGADYIACGNTSYVTKFDMIKTARPGATFLLNTPWVGELRRYAKV